jgi:hypothetical protein
MGALYLHRHGRSDLWNSLCIHMRIIALLFHRWNRNDRSIARLFALYIAGKASSFIAVVAREETVQLKLRRMCVGCYLPLYEHHSNKGSVIERGRMHTVRSDRHERLSSRKLNQVLLLTCIRFMAQTHGHRCQTIQ